MDRINRRYKSMITTIIVTVMLGCVAGMIFIIKDSKVKTYEEIIISDAGDEVESITKEL